MVQSHDTIVLGCCTQHSRKILQVRKPIDFPPSNIEIKQLTTPKIGIERPIPFVFSQSIDNFSNTRLCTIVMCRSCLWQCLRCAPNQPAIFTISHTAHSVGNTVLDRPCSDWRTTLPVYSPTHQIRIRQVNKDFSGSVRGWEGFVVAGGGKLHSCPHLFPVAAPGEYSNPIAIAIHRCRVATLLTFPLMVAICSP
jgi:hypothetical protein